jgi:hypothetical protein
MRYRPCEHFRTNSLALFYPRRVCYTDRVNTFAQIALLYFTHERVCDTARNSFAFTQERGWYRPKRGKDHFNFERAKKNV